MSYSIYLVESHFYHACFNFFLKKVFAKLFSCVLISSHITLYIEL
jgi:hypothetical protein